MNITDIAAWLALFLSGISLYWQWNDKRLRLDVSPSVIVRPPLLTPDASSGNSKKSVSALLVKLSNPGEKPIRVKDVYFVPNNGQGFQVFEDNPLYADLSRLITIDPLREYDFVVSGQRLAETLKARGYTGEVRAIIKVRGELDKQYKSKTIPVSIGQLAEVK